MISEFSPAGAGLAVGFGGCRFVQNLEAYCARGGQSGDHVGEFLPGCLDNGGTGAQDLQYGTSSGVSEWSSRSIGRWVKRTPGQGPGVRPGTAARNVAGTCDVRPSQLAAANPAGPEPGPPSWMALYQPVLVWRRVGRFGSVSDTTGKQRTLPSERGDRRLTPEDRAALQALTEGDELQVLLDEVGKRNPDLSNR